MSVGGRRYHGCGCVPSYFFERRQYCTAVGTGRSGRPFRIGIQHARQFSVLRLMNHAQMVPAEAAGSDHCDTGFQ